VTRAADLPLAGAIAALRRPEATSADPAEMELPPAPRRGEHPSQELKDSITEMALGLLEEQMQARIVHYKADLETNPELDAITATIVAQLKALQSSATVSARPALQRDQIRDSHERLLRGLLERVFRPDAPALLIEKRLKDIHRKLARLFFHSELHEKTRGQDGTVKVIQHGEQAVYYTMVRYEHRLKNELGGFDYASDEIKERAFSLVARFAKEMQDAFLSRRSSELKRIVSIFNGVLLDFFTKQLAPGVGELAREVIHQSGTWEGKSFAYKVSAEAFPRFRVAFERRFMVRLVGFTEDQLVARLADTAGTARAETIKFITDPHVFSMICGELCDSLYEFFCNEGFVDLPPDWRRAAQIETST
jgi:hypothetical protein